MEHNSESFIVVKEFTDKGKTIREVIAKGVTKQGFIDAYTEKGCVMRGDENPHFEDIYSGVVYKLENHFEQGGRLNTYEDLSKEMPSVINENSTCIPIVDLALENSNDYGSFFSEKITSSNDVKEAVDKILQRISGLENQDLVLTLLLSQNNKVKGYLFSYGSNPIEKNADKQDFFRQIVSAIPAGIISVVVGNTEKSNTNEWNYFSNGINKELSFFEIRNLDTLFYDYFGSKNSVSFADSGKMRSGGLVANSYPDLSKEMPSFVSEIDKDFSQNNKISLVKKDKFCGEIPNKIERSFQAAKLFYSAWNKQKIGAVEEMFVLLLTATGRIISLYKHSLGARAGTILDNTIVSAVAVQSKAKGVIVCHNHPSGNLQPSQADIKVTRNLKEALFLCGINLVDSIIITPNENSYTSIFEEGLIMENGGEIIYADGGQVDRERDIQIAKTILMQLGGSNRLQMFTGAYNFVAVPNGVSFRIKNRSVNYVKIVLNAMDTYDIEFGRISGVNYKIVKELSGIYNDQLVEIFTRYTGMVLRLRKGGAIQGEENAEMVMNQNLQIRHHTEELEEILKSGKQVPAWVVSKVSRAADSMSDATHYLEGTPDKMARGGNPRMVDISKLKVYVLTYVPVFDINQAMKIMQKAVYAESEEDAISQLPRKARLLSVKVASGGSRGTPQQQGVRKPSLSQQIRNEIKALKEMLPLLEGKDKKQVQDAIENLEDTLDEMRAEGQYAEGGGVYDSADGISPAIQKAFNSLQNEGYFEKEAIEYVGGIKEWNKLSATEKEIIISDIEKDWRKSTFFAEGGGIDKMAMGGQVSKEYEIIPNTTYQLKIQVYYDKGGMNYFSGGVNKRGYYLSVTPVQIERQGNNVMIESYTAFSGIKKLILEVERQSPKSAEKAKELAESSIPELKQYVLNQMIERGEIPQDMPNPEPEPLPEPDFNIEQVKGEIEALKELLPFLEGDDKKEIEEQIDILSIALKQNENFGGGAEKEQIKQWYRINYPDDDLGNELNDAVTFEDLWNGLHNGSDVYEIIGVADSIIRERLFEHLAEIYGVDYDYVYKKWLDSDEPDAPNADENLSQKFYIDFLNKKKGFKQDRIYFNSYEEAKDWAIKNFERFDPDMIRIQMAKGGGIGEPYNSMTKYQLEKELKKLTDEWFDIRKSYSTDNHPRQIEIDKEKDKIITLLYGENFSGKGQKFKYANGGGVGKDILDKEFWKDIAHLWRTMHIDIDKNGDWYNTEKYKGGVNNTSGLYFTNESANFIVGLANSYNVTLLDVKNNNPNYTAFDYDKKRLEEFRNKEYAKGGGVGNFPPKGELKNKENLLLKYEKIGSDYEFFVYKPEKKDVSSYEQIKYVCVNKDCPTRMSYNQFLNYLYAETYLDDRKYANGGGVGELEKEIDAIYFKSGFINYHFNWRLKLLEMLQDQSIEAYNIYQKLTDKQKDDVLQEQFEMDNDMGSDGDGEMETSFENLNILLQDASNGKIYAKGGEVFVCPVGTQIQSLIFDKSMFNLRQAKAWAKKNNFENDFVDGKLNTLRIRQKDPAMFTEDGFRTIQLRQGVQAVIGCPKKRTIRRKK